MNEYFRELRNLGQKIDDDIQKLEKTWETPHLLIGGYGTNFEEASPYVESFFGTLKEVQDQLIEDRESRVKYISKTDKYLADVDTFYKDLKQQCQEVESLLSEYGYKPLAASMASLAIDESEAEFSSLTPEQTDNNDISLSRSIRCSLDEKENFVPLRIGDPKSIATPASHIVASSSKIAASYYGNIMTSCAKKSVLRMEPEVKRTICKSCQSPLIPGETARIRLTSKRIRAIKWICLACKTTRKIPLQRSNKLWIDQPDSLMQIFDYTPQMEFPTPSEILTTDEPPGNHPTDSTLQQKLTIPQ